MQVKKELKNTDPSIFDFAEGTAIFINESLCSYYKIQWNKCKKLWGKKQYMQLILYLKWDYLLQDKGKWKCSYNLQILWVLKRILRILTYMTWIIVVVWCLVFEKLLFGMPLISLELLISFFRFCFWDNTLNTAFIFPMILSCFTFCSE